MGPMWPHLITTAVLLSCAFVACELTDATPKIEIVPQKQTVKRGDIAVFICTFTGGPNLQIYWTRNEGSEVLDRSRYEFLYGYDDENVGKIPIFETISMTNGSVLRIHALGSETFDCIVGNGVHELVKATAHLEMIIINNEWNAFPHIVRQKTEVQVVGKGHRTLLSCQTADNFKNTIRWLRNKLPLDMSVSRYSLLEEQFLKISDVKEEDEGEYECIANHSELFVLSPKIKLFVSERRRLEPYFIIKPEVLYAELRGRSLNITCLANGSPLPSVKWMNGSTVISPDRDGLNVLELTDIHGSHSYTCVASSEMGTKEAIAQVIAQGIPQTPTNLTVSDVTATCVKLSWSYKNPLDDGIEGYMIGYLPIINFDGVGHKYSVKPFVTICDLKPDTEYEFYVVAENKIGDGDRSKYSYAFTKKQ